MAERQEGQEGRQKRITRFNTRLSEDEVRAEKAVERRNTRSGLLGDLRKRASQLRKSLENPETCFTDIEAEVCQYNKAFCRFVDAHEACMQIECDEERKLSMSDSYENQRDLKLQLDLMLKRLVAPSLSGSKKSSRSSRPSVRSSRSSVRERKKLEEAKLNVEALRRRQEIDREIEQMEKGKAELERKIELLEAETRVKQAVIDLTMEQSGVESTIADDLSIPSDPEECSNSQHDNQDIEQTQCNINEINSEEPCVVDSLNDGMNKLSMQSTHEPTQTPCTPAQNPVIKHTTQSTAAENSVIDQTTQAVSKIPVSTFSPRLDSTETVFTSYNYTGGSTFQPTQTVSTIPNTGSPGTINYVNTPAVGISQQAYSVPVLTTCTPQMSTTPCQSQHSTCFPMSCGPITSTVSSSYEHNAATHFNPIETHFNPGYQYQSTPYSYVPQYQEHSQIDALTTIAQIIKQGPSLPKIELMRFGGDPLEYAEFVTNFKDNIESQVTDDSQRLTRLLAQCDGKAKDAIRSCVNLPLGTRYKEAWKTLLDNFGQPHMIAEAHMRKLKEISVRKSDASSLMDFARKLEDARRVLTNMGPNYSCRLDNEETIVSLMRKLPDESLKRRWADKAGDIIKTKGRAEYKDFVDFVRKTADRLNNRYGQELRGCPTRETKEKEKQDQRTKVTTLAARGESSKQSSVNYVTLPPKCQHCSGPHNIWRCNDFKGLALDERLKIVKKQGLCRICLGEGHFANSCTKGFSCRVTGCGSDHHYLLHPTGGETRNNDGKFKQTNNNPQTTAAKRQPFRPSTSSVNNNATVTNIDKISVGTVETSRPRVCFKVVPVKVSSKSGDKVVYTNAFFDSGSDATLCLDSLVNELEINDPRPTSYVMTTVDCEEQKAGYSVELNVESLTGDTKFCLENVLTTQSLPVTPKHVASNDELRRWSHLSDVVLPEIEKKNVAILIGSDRPDIIDIAHEKRVGSKGEPFAVKTPLGWTVYGPVEEHNDGRIHINLTSTEHEDLNEKLELMYDEHFKDTYSEEEGTSIEDRRAKAIMDESTTLVDGHYQIKLPFRQDQPHFPDSKPTAERRLTWLKKRMEKDHTFKEKYTRVVEKYKSEGSSREVPEKEVPTMNPIWYLPHHAVWHPRKPEEPRVVFDCAAKTKGVSLNNQLLRGPENTSSLIGVILRFRVESVAVAADVKRMFHQVFVAPEDRGALCYLWWPDGDITKEPKTHQMLVHIFGATSSPSVAEYALRRTAQDNSSEYSPDAVQAVQRDFYVDDLLKSFPDAEQATEVCKQIQSIVARGGFTLTKWMSNDRDVLSTFPEDEYAPAVKNLDLKRDSLPIDRALGIHWDVEEDTFRMEASKKEHPQSRKGVLSSIATVYDPLGFASPLLLMGREINQELCRLKYNWNDELPEDLLLLWKEWREGLLSLQDFSIPRCYKPKEFGPIQSAEVHHFADASQEHGYGTASYVRLVNERGEIHCSFIMGKARVKPLKTTMTVPKLELTAATLLIRMNDILVKELDGRLPIDDTMYWTDSMIVLGYIKNNTKRFPTFVANRVAKIREGSEPTQWRHVRSEQNPADYASRGIKANESEKLERWKNGPEFLWRGREEWPQQPDEVSLEEGNDEVLVASTAIQSTFWNDLFYRYSCWNRLRRVVAWLIRVAYLLKKESHSSDIKKDRDDKKGKHLSVSEVERAEIKIVKAVQEQSFQEDVALNKGSLARLNAFKQDNEIIRVGGRLNRSQLPYDMKHPLILPSKHPVTELIILHYHIQNGHAGTHQVLSEIRHRYWIVNGASSVKRVLSKCHECRRQNAKMGEQITAPLPEIRVSSDEDQLVYPFAAVGLDYFGPLYVKTGPETRSSKRNPSLNKRYGCIFTCLRYRAVHIEVAQDLTSDSFINAVLRFVSRRGPPRVIYSDNGTNFRGAELDVLHAMKTWNQDHIQSTLNQRGIDWKFNPPLASHQGGVWERLIRSIRRILHAMIGERLVNEETLRTFLTEVEKVMNDRPLTKVSDDPHDLEALTPNHILLLRRNPALATEGIDEADKYKARWKHVHLLGNEFWQRWMKEYLPALQERQRWLKKKANLKVGDLVLVADKNTPRGQWPKALIEEVYPDADNVVRRVTVRTAEGTYLRDIRKICLLEEDLMKKTQED